MTIQVDKLIKEFYTSIKEKYPDLTLDEVEVMCKQFFYYIRSCMQDDSMPLIHIKYLGKFIVYPGKVRTLLKNQITALNRGTITQEQFEERSKTFINYLKENNEEIPDTNLE